MGDLSITHDTRIYNLAHILTPIHLPVSTAGYTDDGHGRSQGSGVIWAAQHMDTISPHAPLPPREDQVTGCGASPSSGSSAFSGHANVPGSGNSARACS